MTPLGPVIGKVMNQGPNLRELISSADGVTFWAKHDKGMERLDYSPRGLEQGLRDTLEAEGKLPAGADSRGLAQHQPLATLSGMCRNVEHSITSSRRPRTRRCAKRPSNTSAR